MTRPLSTESRVGRRLRVATVERRTRETDIRVEIDLDRPVAGPDGLVDIATGIGFLDHMLTSLATHAGWSLTLRARGDLEIDDHHTAEDVALSLGRAIDEAIGDRRGLSRFGEATVPLDEALARAVIDISSRPGAFVALDLRREMLGAIATENLTHFVQSLAVAARLTLHLDVLRGENDHHRAEAAFKSLALAFRRALRLTGDDSVPSTKGTLDG